MKRKLVPLTVSQSTQFILHWSCNKRSFQKYASALFLQKKGRGKERKRGLAGRSCILICNSKAVNEYGLSLFTGQRSTVTTAGHWEEDVLRSVFSEKLHTTEDGKRDSQ